MKLTNLSLKFPKKLLIICNSQDEYLFFEDLLYEVNDIDINKKQIEIPINLIKNKSKAFETQEIILSCIVKDPDSKINYDESVYLIQIN